MDGSCFQSGLVYWAEVVGLADLLCCREEVSMRLEQARQVPGGDSNEIGGLRQAPAGAFQKVQQNRRDMPEPVVPFAHCNSQGGAWLLAARSERALANDLRKNRPIGHVNLHAVATGYIHSQSPKSKAFVIVLRAGIVTVGRDAGWAVMQANCGGYLIAMLTAGSGRLVYVHVALLEKVRVLQREIWAAVGHCCMIVPMQAQANGNAPARCPADRQREAI